MKKPRGEIRSGAFSWWAAVVGRAFILGPTEGWTRGAAG